MVIPNTDDNVSSNSNIIAAYTYNESSCVTGEETSCVKTTCYQNKTSNSCPAGTIIKYKVNSSTTKYFYVLHDDGATMTLQQRENTSGNKEWYSGKSSYDGVNPDNTKGPLTVLSVVESATDTWNNVNTISYTMGSTTFKTNAYTSCSFSSSSNLVCDTMGYTLSKRNAKARLITVQEAMSLGCQMTVYATAACPKWMWHTADSSSQGYWTMNSANYISDDPKTATYMALYISGGVITAKNAYATDVGERAVVEINK